MRVIVTLLFITFIAAFYACKHDTGVTPIDPAIPGTPTVPGIPGTPPVFSTCSPDTTYFTQTVLPIFVSNCTFSGCHDQASHQDGIVLTNYNGIRQEVEPFDLNDSEIWEKINETDPSDRMPPPPRNPLSAAQKQIIRNWILQGAKNNSCQPSLCDTATVTYSAQIKNIISAKCQGCHSSTAPANGYDFSAYAGVKARIVDGRLWGAINHMAGFSPMPKNGTKLSDCEIATFKKWIDAGSPNN
jgi:mono/diheme cytochrome c family protein